MEPITTAALVMAIGALGQKVAESAAEKIGEQSVDLAIAAFGKVKSLLGLKSEPGSPTLQQEAAQALAARPELFAQVRQIVPAEFFRGGGISIGQINATKVVTAEKLDVQGNFNM